MTHHYNLHIPIQEIRVFRLRLAITRDTTYYYTIMPKELEEAKNLIHWMMTHGIRFELQDEETK